MRTSTAALSSRQPRFAPPAPRAPSALWPPLAQPSLTRLRHSWTEAAHQAEAPRCTIVSRGSPSGHKPPVATARTTGQPSGQPAQEQTTWRSGCAPSCALQQGTIAFRHRKVLSEPRRQTIVVKLVPAAQQPQRVAPYCSRRRMRRRPKQPRLQQHMLRWFVS
jgi:hypothetical protein